MFVAHAPAGYLVGRALRDRLGARDAVPLSIVGALLPDIDLVAWLATGRHHHAFPTHFPATWLALGAAALALGGAARSRPVARVALGAAIVAGNALLHLVLDSVVGDVRWLAPLSDHAFAMFHVQRLLEPWWLNFLVHPSFGAEIVLVAVAASRAAADRAIRRGGGGFVELTGKVALVTGASSGIGLAVARRLVADGATVVMVARTAAALERAAAELGPRAIAHALDVGDLGALAALPGEIAKRHGRLDIVVNNAGVHHRGPVATIEPGQHADMVHVNLAAPIVLSRAALPHLGPGGAIVAVTSLAGRLPLRDSATYSATKAGLRFFTRALAEEHPDLVVSCVSPGPVDTPFFDDVAKVSDLTFSQPMSTADQVADAVVACLGRPSTEVSIPASSGMLTTVGYLFPSVVRALRPSMIRRGARNKAAYVARRAGTP